MFTDHTKVRVNQFIGDAIFVVTIVSLCLVLALPSYRNGIGLGDEGFLAYGAVRVLEGQMPNRDFFSLQPPLSFYTAAAVFKFFGTSLNTLRTMGVIIYVLVAVLVYALSRQFVGTILAFAASVPATLLGMPFFFFVPFAVWHGVLVTLVAALCIMRAVATGKRWWAFLAGILTVLVALSRHDQSFYLAVAILAYALALKFAKPETAAKLNPSQLIFVWAAGAAVLILPVGLYWLVSDAIPHMFGQLIIFPLTTYAKTSSLPMPGFHAGQPTFHKIMAGIFYLPPVVQVLTVVVLFTHFARRRFSMEHAAVTFILVLSILFYCQVLTRSDLHHLLITLDPFFVLCAWWLGTTSKAVYGIIKRAYHPYQNDQLASFVAVALVLLLVGGIGTMFMFYTKPLFLRDLKQPTRTILPDRAGVQINSTEASSLENVVKQIKNFARPGRSILCLPYQPMLYFLSERRNPTRWNDLWPDAQTPEDHLTLIKQAQEDPPAVVLIVGKSSLQRYAATIIDYVESEYRIVDEDVESTYRTADRDFSLTWYLPLNREK